MRDIRGKFPFLFPFLWPQLSVKAAQVLEIYLNMEKLNT